ncbi:MAG TPA: 50S ribosomal protein L25 [Gaiellaceae bacterium]|nr:50S ribosomal protein L25 [Gaiellaceae bacterium]
MAGERVKLEVQERETVGSTAATRLRREGFIPGVLYGRGKTPHAIAVPERELRTVLTGPHGRHAILDVVLQGQKTTHASILKDYQVDPIRGRITHFDLHEVRLDEAITAQVAIELVGESPGVKVGGVLSALVREVSVEALPLEIPDKLELDIGESEIGTTLRVADLVAPEGTKILDDPDTVVVTVAAPRVEVEEEPEEELAEGEEAAEGEEPAGEGESEESEAGQAEPAGDEE